MESSGDSTFAFINDCIYTNTIKSFVTDCAEIDDGIYAFYVDPYTRSAQGASCP